jgi:hypothetical protein
MYQQMLHRFPDTRYNANKMCLWWESMMLNSEHVISYVIEAGALVQFDCERFLCVCLFLTISTI